MPPPRRISKRKLQVVDRHGILLERQRKPQARKQDTHLLLSPRATGVLLEVLCDAPSRASERGRVIVAAIIAELTQ